MGIRIEQVDIKSLNKVFLMKDEVKDIIKIVETADSKIKDLDSKITTETGKINATLETKADKNSLSKVATTGDYNDLINLPKGVTDLNDKVINDNQSPSSTVIWSSEKIIDYINKNVGTQVTENINELKNKVNIVTNNLNDTNKKIESLAQQKEITRLEGLITKKLDASELDKINQSISTKVDYTTFKVLEDEVIKARRGKKTLLDKIIEIDSRLDLVTTTSSDASIDLPIGSIIWYAGKTAPKTYKVCDGSELSRNTYYSLFKVIKTSYGEGNKTDTFNIPNLMNEELFIRSSGGNLSVGTKQIKDVTDVRQSYEGTHNTNKLYIVGGKAFNEEVKDSKFEPASISLLPCIKIEEDLTENSNLPIGIMSWFTNDLPEDYMECDGSAISRKDYADLFAIIGTTYGEGDKSTTFNLPNLKSKNLFVKSAKTADNVGKITEGDSVLTDIRKAYEGDKSTDRFYPVGGNSFINEHENSELNPPSIALTSAIKVKNIETKNDKVKIGAFSWFSSDTKPIGYVICDGSEISRFEYKELFSAIGTKFGQGDGVSTFNVPNLMESNRFVRAAGGNVAIATKQNIDLVDVREAYEGEKCPTGLYPLGAKYFTDNVINEDIHPNNIALLPCIKALNIKPVDTSRIMKMLDSQVSLLSLDKENSDVSFKKEVQLKDGRAKVVLQNKDLSLNNVKSCFVNVCNTDKGSEYICDINANASVTKNEITIYLRALETKVSNSKVSLDLKIVY